jgi:hypothetical protein
MCRSAVSGFFMQIITGAGAAQVLGSSAFDVVPYAARYEALADRLKLDFSSVIFTLNHLPLGLRGAEHTAQRADVARLIAERRESVTAALPEIVERWFACLGRPGGHDLMQQAIVPCVDALIAELVGIAPDLGENSLISRVFSQKIGVAQRRRLEAELARLTARLRAAFPQDSDTRIGSRITLIVLGRDALVGTLAQSLLSLFRLLGGRALNSLRLTVPPSHTGVPYIDREAMRPGDVGGCPVAGGEVLRCLLQSLEGLPDADRLRFFGAGAHVCLGRTATLDLFRVLADHLEGLSSSVTVLGSELRDCDVFALPERLEIEVS